MDTHIMPLSAPTNLGRFLSGKQPCLLLGEDSESLIEAISQMASSCMESPLVIPIDCARIPFEEVRSDTLVVPPTIAEALGLLQNKIALTALVLSCIRQAKNIPTVVIVSNVDRWQNSAGGRAALRLILAPLIFALSMSQIRVVFTASPEGDIGRFLKDYDNPPVLALDLG